MIVEIQELIQLFHLERLANSTQSGTDAILTLNSLYIPFELKSTTKTSVTTVRDFGLEHIKKWRGQHWLFGFYEKGGKTLKYCLYASPKMMAPWISEKLAYVALDYKLSQLIPELISISLLYEIVGEKEVYTLADAQSLQKRQYTIQEYQNKMDLEFGYSAERMLLILRDRCQYLIERGSTLNNPHIPASYFKGWERIITNHAQRLRELVTKTIQENT